MNCEVVSFKSLLASAILKFDFVDSIDITLIMASLKLLGVEVGNHVLGNLKDYITFNNGIMKKTTSMKEEVLNARLKRIAGKKTISYLEQIDMSNLVLHKIKLLFAIKRDNLKNLFNKQELEELYKLLEQGYVEFTELDNKELVLTKKGLVKLFIEKNRIEVSKFQEMLNRLNYDFDLFVEFLETIDNLDNYILNEETLIAFEIYQQMHILNSKNRGGSLC